MKSLVYSKCGRERKSIKMYIVTLFVCSTIMIGCSSAPTFIRPDYEQRQIKSMAIMPVTDKRSAAEDTVQAQKDLINIEEIISEKLLDKNYDVVSPGTVKNILKENPIGNMTPENLCSMLKVDGVLFSELYDYTDIFFVNHSIKMDLKVYDAQGDSLWINKLDDSDRPFLSAIGASLGWAIGVSLDNKVASKNKIPIIIAGVAAAEVVYVIVDGVSNETSQSIDKVFKSLPESKSTMK
jgi:hypothetical protein